MDLKEAQWIRRALEEFPPEAISPLLNIGSSTLEFRTKTQPWISDELITPLTKRGIQVIHVDIKNGPGIDLVADIFQPADFGKLAALRARALLCSNILEHVPDPAVFAGLCERLLPPGGIGVITGPYSYPYHRDPIDTMFRPTPAQAAGLFPHCEPLSQGFIDAGKSYRDNVRARPLIIFRHVFRAPFPIFGWRAWKRSMRKLYWLFHNYIYFGVVVRKRG